jgi:hypothetical protein
LEELRREVIEVSAPNLPFVSEAGILDIGVLDTHLVERSESGLGARNPPWEVPAQKLPAHSNFTDVPVDS